MLTDEERLEVYKRAQEIAKERAKHRTEVTYFDEFGQICDKKYAKTAIFCEYDEKGNRVSETYGEFKPSSILQEDENLGEDLEEKKTRSI